MVDPVAPNIVHTVDASVGGNSTVVASKTKRSVEEWRRISYQRCFGDGFFSSSWDWTLGWEGTNQANLAKVYNYYGNLNAKKPTQYHWPGLGKLAGGTVVSGLNLSAMANVFGSPADDRFLPICRHRESHFRRRRVAIRSPFRRRQTELEGLLPDYDTQFSGPFPCLDAWRLIDKGRDDAVNGSNKLLAHEQKWVIQNKYKDLQRNILINRARAFTPCPHPYGRDFIESLPQGDRFNVDDRWSWIMQEMWPSWVGLPDTERRRLIDLPFPALVGRNFGALLQDHLPPGEPGDND